MENPSTDFSEKLGAIFGKYDSAELIANVRVRFESYRFSGHRFVSTIVDDITENCYVASPYSMIVRYSRDELSKLPSKLSRLVLGLLIRSYSVVLRLARIDRVQMLNNLLLSTNFFASFWETFDDVGLERIAVAKYPEHALLIRSVNEIQNPKLLIRLTRRGWIRVVSRQIYIFEDKERWMSCHNAVIDDNLLSSERFVFVPVDVRNKNDFETAERLYDLLYLEKYSVHNVQFKAIYLRELVSAGLVHLRLLFDKERGRAVGVVGMMGEDGWITAPIVGYDTSIPIRDALYRRIIAYIVRYAMEHGYILNLSSGAPEFKKLRGAKPVLEYMMVKIDHLPLFRKTIWRSLAVISNSYYAHILRKNGL